MSLRETASFLTPEKRNTPDKPGATLSTTIGSRFGIKYKDTNASERLPVN